MNDQTATGDSRLTLALDTTGARLGVALARGGELLGALLARPAGSHTESLPSSIRRLLEICGACFEDVRLVGAVTGPGSFAGIRIGLACAQGIADALGIPMVGQNAMELLAQHPASPRGIVAVLQDARRGNLFAACYNTGGEKSEVLRPPSEIAQAEAEEWVDGLTPDAIVASAQLPSGILKERRHPLIVPFPAGLAPVLALGAHTLHFACPGEPVEAFYIRPPDAKLPQKKGISS